jgi:hypothetical protein
MKHKIEGSIMIQTGLGKKQNPHLQNNQSKKAGGGAQAVQHLPCKHKALSSNPHTTKKEKDSPNPQNSAPREKNCKFFKYWPHTKVWGSDGFTGEFLKSFDKEMTVWLRKRSRTEEEKMHPNCFCKASTILSLKLIKIARTHTPHATEDTLCTAVQICLPRRFNRNKFH